MKAPTLYVSRDHVFDWLIAVEFGEVVDGQPEDHYDPLGEDVAFCLDGPEGRPVGFVVKGLSSFDPEDHEELWGDSPLFDAPLFGLRGVPAGAITLAAQSHYLQESTTNRLIFQAATGAKGQEAVDLWRQCLEVGDSMAHYGLGYTLLGQGHHREAYGHLRAYTEICPWNAWAWRWLGKACEAGGEITSARQAYERAIELDGDETDAEELLDALAEWG